MKRIYLFWAVIALIGLLCLSGLFVLFSSKDTSFLIVAIFLELLALALLALTVRAYIFSMRARSGETPRQSFLASLLLLNTDRRTSQSGKPRSILSMISVVLVTVLAAWLIFLWSATTVASVSHPGAPATSTPTTTATPAHKATPTHNPKPQHSPTVTPPPMPTPTPNTQGTPFQP